MTRYYAQANAYIGPRRMQKQNGFRTPKPEPFWAIKTKTCFGAVACVRKNTEGQNGQDGEIIPRQRCKTFFDVACINTQFRITKGESVMEFTSKQNKDRVLIGIEGRILSMLDAEPLLGEVESQLQNGHALFILDLSKTEYLNSEGLNVLLKILTKTRNAGGDTVLCRISGELEKLFIITKLAHIFTILPTVKESEEFLKNKFKKVTV